MRASTSIPGELYNANLALCLRVNELMQVGGQQWVDSRMRLFEDNVTDATADYPPSTRHEPGTPTNASSRDFWREAERWSVRVQAARSLALEQQRSLATSLREAVTTWGTAVNGSLARESGTMPFTDAWVSELTKWTQAWPVVGKK